LEPNAPKLILVPTDFSAPSAQALRYGAALAERVSAHLLVIHADTFVPPVDFTISAAGVFDMPREELVDVAREQLQAFAETNISRSVPYDVRVLIGVPIDAIVAQTEETGADLIIMGTHGRTGLRRLLVGSVTEAVMRLAPVPVIVVHEQSRLESADMRRIVSVPRSTAEAAAAAAYAGVFADAAAAQFVEVPAGADASEVARVGEADLIVLGIAAERSFADALRGTMAERVVQQSTCPVLTVNHFAAARIAAIGTGGATLDHEPALSA
jgi:nucleotide-binding universal stress UspA family protein